MTAPSRRPVTARVLDVVERPGVYRIEFTPDEVGTHLIDVSIDNYIFLYYLFYPYPQIIIRFKMIFLIHYMTKQNAALSFATTHLNSTQPPEFGGERGNRRS